jgi:hypothetical protein
LCKQLHGAGNEAEESAEKAEEAIEGGGSEAAFESALDASRIGLRAQNAG